MPDKPNRPLFVDHRADDVEAWRTALHPVEGHGFNTYSVTKASRRRLERLSWYADLYQTMIVNVSPADMTIAIFPRKRQPAPDVHLEAAYDDRFER